VASVEAGAPPKHKELLVSAGHDDIIRTIIYTGRPMNVRKTPYVVDWETRRQQEIAEIVSRGRVPHYAELDKHPEKFVEGRECKEYLSELTVPFSLGHTGLMGKVAGSINVRPENIVKFVC